MSSQETFYSINSGDGWFISIELRSTGHGPGTVPLARYVFILFLLWNQRTNSKIPPLVPDGPSEA